MYQPKIAVEMDIGAPIFILADEPMVHRYKAIRKAGYHIRGTWLSPDWKVRTSLLKDGGEIAHEVSHRNIAPVAAVVERLIALAEKQSNA